MRAVLSILAVLATFHPASLRSADSLGPWSVRSTQLPSFRGVAASQDRVVAVGDAGSVAWSLDGLDWHFESIEVTNSLRQVVYGEGVFLAVGTAGFLARSADGEHWTVIPTSRTESLMGISWRGGRGVVCGEGGLLMTSVDPGGEGWSVVPTDTTVSLNSVAQSDALTVAVGSGGTVVASSDQVPWTSRQLEMSSDLLAVRFIENAFVAVGKGGVIGRSTDGRAWTLRRLNPAQINSILLFDVTAVGDRFVAAGGSNRSTNGYALVATSDTGLEWETANPPMLPVHSMVWFRGLLVAVGTGGLVATSPDVREWTTRRSGLPESPWSVSGTGQTYWIASYTQPLDDVFAPSGNIRLQTLFRSPDLTTWEGVGMDSTPAAIQFAAGGGIQVAVGDHGGVWVSQDGQTWEVRQTGVDALLTDVVFGDAGFVAVGTESAGSRSWGMILHSSDGEVWELASVASSFPLRHLAYGRGIYVAAGLREVFSSTDGRKWSRQRLDVDSGLLDVAFGNGRFVGANDSDVYTSRDGVGWAKKTISGVSVRSVAFGKGRFLGLGSFRSLRISYDGVQWQGQSSPSAERLNSVAFMGGRFVAVGNPGIVAETGPVPSMAPISLKGPQGATVGHHSPFELSVDFAASDPVRIQWFKNRRPVAGATNDILRFTDIDWRSSGDYHVEVVSDRGRIRTQPATVTVLPPSPSDHWQVVKYPGTDIELDRLAYGDGLFVATTPDRRLVSSTNGTHWAYIDLADKTQWYGVRYVAPYFLALGSNGALRTSTDGVVWMRRETGTTAGLRDITQGDLAWVVVGEKGTILWSPDLSVWKRQESGVVSRLNAVIWADGEFAAVGDHGVILSSWDGRTWWRDATVTGTDLYGVAFGAGDWMAVGDSENGLVSDDGDWWRWTSTWVSFPTARLRDVVYQYDRLLAYGPGWFAGVNGWGPTTGPALFSSLATGPGVLYGAAGTAVMEITAPRTYVPLGGKANAHLRCVSDNARGIMAVGDSGAIVYSESGDHWSMIDSGVTNNLRGVAGREDRWVVVGEAGLVLTSSDGLRWESAGSVTSNDLLDVAEGGGFFVAVGASGTVLASEDGLHWEDHTLPTKSHVSRVRYLNGAFWAVAWRNLFVSSNTVEWAGHAAGSLTGWFEDIESRPGGYMAISPSHFWISNVSNEEMKWVQQSRTVLPMQVNRLAFANGLFAAAGGSDQIAFSTDGVDWYARRAPQPWTIRDLKAIRGAFYAVGDYGVIIRTAPHARLELVRGDIPELEIKGGTDRAYRVEYSEDPDANAVWTPLPPARETGSGVRWIDVTATNAPARFYRAVLE